MRIDGMSFEIPPPPSDGSFDEWAEMRESQQWLVRGTFPFDSAATVQAVSDFLDTKPREPRVCVETDLADREARLMFPPDASDEEVEIWTARILASGLFVEPGSA
jgi:hypothetical protein